MSGSESCPRENRINMHTFKNATTIMSMYFTHSNEVC